MRWLFGNEPANLCPSLVRRWITNLCQGKIKDSQLFVVDDSPIPLELCVPDCVECVGTGISALGLLGRVPHNVALLVGTVDSHLSGKQINFIEPNKTSNKDLYVRDEKIIRFHRVQMSRFEDLEADDA